MIRVPKVVILRLGHRPKTDRRISSHVALVSRALGADGIIFTDRRIKGVKRTIEGVNKNWGNSFFVRVEESWRKTIEEWRSSGGLIVHLTMYGLPINEEISKIRGNDVLTIVGAEKVPSDLFGMADFNIAIGNQPHSEVASLAIFLDRFFEGSELEKNYTGGKIKIIPSNSGKKAEKLDA